MSDRDELDRLADELFSSARGERPTAGAKSSVLAAVLEASDRRATPRASKRDEAKPSWVWPVATASVALAAGFTLMWSSSFFRTDPPSVAPESAQSEPLEHEAKPTAPKTVAIPVTIPPTSSSSAPVRIPEKPPAPTPPTLSEEVVMLDEVRAKLSARDTAGALKVLESYERRPSTRLGDEATLLRLEALAGSGRTTEAAELAARFVAKNPESTLADQARTYLKTEVPDGGRP